MGEMKRGVEEVERGTELESENPARVAVEPVDSKVVPSFAVAVDSGSRDARLRPSLSSVATDGEATGPPKDVREFV